MMLKGANGKEDLSTVDAVIQDYNMDGYVNILDVISLLKDLNK